MSAVVPTTLAVSVAPMMAYTDTYFRSLLAIVHPRALLYTEMIHADALMRPPHWRDVLVREARQKHLVIQLGGSCPETLGGAARRIASVGGFSAINLNVGCPSPRVQAGRFGACLFTEPQLVADCVASMQEASQMMVTVKTRLGVDNIDHYDDLTRFVEIVAKRGCRTFIIHARKAWLKGLNPAQNRSIPPLHYDRVAQLVKDFPTLQFVVNGGIQYDDVLSGQHDHFSGVMLGRCVYADPLGLSRLRDDAPTDMAAFRNMVAMTYLAHMQQWGYTHVSPRLVMPLVLISKGFAGARSARAAWVEWGKTHASIAATQKRILIPCVLT